MNSHARRHARFLKEYQPLGPNDAVEAELKQFGALSYNKLTDAAFARAETPDNIRDLHYLFLGGANVSYDPVIGSLSGFESPVNLQAVRRVRLEKPGRLSHKAGLSA
jgi:hypothetical protein